MSLKIFWF